MMRHFFRYRFGSSAILVFLISLLFLRGVTSAQEGEEWSAPTNLSKTGSATEPVVVVDNNDDYHVLWKDAFAGFVYSKGDGNSWSQPVAVQLPFSEPPLSSPGTFGFVSLYNPGLIIDGDNILHGFWIDQMGLLWYSQAAVSELQSPDSWSLPVILAESALSFDIGVDANGRLHLSYVRPITTVDFPAGIYYRQSEDNGLTWSTGQIIYQSSYLASISPAQANIQMSVGNSIHLVWDDPLLETVFSARSSLGGTTWSTPIRIDRREPNDEPGAAGPAKINIVVKGQEVHLTWQAQHELLDCIQYHQWSRDNGLNWESIQAAYEGSGGCPVNVRFLVSSDDLIFLLIDLGGQVVMQAWDGSAWGEPELQQPLAGFTNPETFRTVTYACQQPITTDDNRLFMIGCGTSNGSDIWMLERPLGSLSSWFPPLENVVWSPPTSIYDSQVTLLSPTLVTDSDGLIHAFWIETSEDDIVATDTKIHYSSWDGTAWSRIIPVINLGPQKADQLSVIFANERFFVIWREPGSNTYFISQVEIEQLLIPVEWSTPQELSVPQTTVVSRPSMFHDQMGDVNIIYSVPFNENRGIYLIRSEDDGTTWSEPLMIFDGVAAGWSALDQPLLAGTESDHLHALWAKDELQPEPVPRALFYSHSMDNGEVWSGAEMMAEGNITWHQLRSVGKRTIIVTWQEQIGVQTRLWSRQSFDDGISWERPLLISSVSGISNDMIRMAMATDQADQQHLIQTTSDDLSGFDLQEWIWQGEDWKIGEQFTLDTGVTGSLLINSIAASAIRDQLVILLSLSEIQQANNTMVNRLFATNRTIDLPLGTPTPQPTLMPTIEPMQTVTPTLTPSPTPLPSFESAGNEGNSSPISFIDLNSTTSKVIFSVLPAGFVVVLIFALYLINRNRTK